MVEYTTHRYNKMKDIILSARGDENDTHWCYIYRCWYNLDNESGINKCSNLRG